MTHTPDLPTESNLIKTEHEVNYYVERAHQLREEALTQFAIDAGRAIANAFHGASAWIAQRLHLSTNRHPSSHA